MENGHCKKCGAALIQESRHIVGISERTSTMEKIQLKCEVVLVCPGYNKPFGWLFSHTRIKAIRYE